MAQPPRPSQVVTNPRIAKLIELEVSGRIKPEHQQELDTLRAQGLAPKKSGTGSLTEAQGKSTGFYERAQQADENFTQTHSATEPRGLAGAAAAAVLPEALVNSFTSDDRQLSEQAKRNFIMASLRYESGAAIGKDEFTKQDVAFFPQPGDSAATIAQKAADRKVVIESLKAGSGGGPAQVEAQRNQQQPPAPASVPAPAPTAADPNAPVSGATVTAPILEAGSANIIGTPTTGPRPTIDIHDETAAQTPEFRAGLAKLLSDPKVGADQIRQYWSENAKGAPVPATPAQAEQIAPLAVERGKNGLTDRLDATIRGAADTAFLGFADELAAGARTVFGNKTMAENLAAERGVDDYDTQNHFGYRLGGQLAGGTVLPMGEATDAASLAKAGGGYGAAYGFGSTNGSLQDRFVGAGIGGVTGAAGGYGLGKLSELYRGRAPTPPGGPTTGNEVADAAARQNVPIIAADAAPGTRGVTSFLETVPGSTGLIRNRMQDTTDAIEERVGGLTPQHIAPADRTAVGEQVQAGAQNWIRRSSDIGGRLYDRAYQLADGAQATPNGMLAEINRHLTDLERTPAANRQKIEALTNLRNDLVDATDNPRPLDIDSLRNIRSGIREQMDASNVRSSDLDRRLDEVMQAGRRDIQESLNGNPRALAAFDRADQFWADRVQRVDNVLSKVIGKADDTLSGEQVMAKIEGMAAPRTGNADNLRTLLSSLRPDEREQVAANVAHALGRATPEAEFSAQRFFTQVNKLSPRARVAVFGRNGADALADLATIAEGRADSQARMNNSGSGRVSNWWRALRGTMGIGVGYGAATSPGITAATTALALGGANISARVLTNPAVARALAQGLRATTVQGARSTLERLGNIATSNPAIRTEVLSIQRRLAQAVNDNLPVAGRAAASPDEGPGNEQ